jgi:hypothetical protein
MLLSDCPCWRTYDHSRCYGHPLRSLVRESDLRCFCYFSRGAPGRITRCPKLHRAIGNRCKSAAATNAALYPPTGSDDAARRRRVSGVATSSTRRIIRSLCPISSKISADEKRVQIRQLACGYALANKGIDTRTLQAYLGHRSVTEEPSARAGVLIALRLCGSLASGVDLVRKFDVPRRKVQP